MTYVGYIVDSENKKVPLTYGEETDMLAWKELNIKTNSSTELFLLPDTADAPRCLSDAEYFRSLT